MSSRAVARALRRLQGRGGGLSAPAQRVPRDVKLNHLRHFFASSLFSSNRERVLSRSVSGVAAQPCHSCDKLVLELRKEMLSENQRVWMMYEGLLDVNHKMLKKMCEMEARAAERQVIAVENMVKTSYRILGSGGAFMMGMFLVISPLLKAAWQQDTIDAMERKLLLKKVASMMKAKAAEEGTERKASEESQGGNVAQADGTEGKASQAPQGANVAQADGSKE